MYRFYVPPENIKQDQENRSYAIICGAEFVHLARVLRLQPGEEIKLFDGQGQEYTGQISSLQKTEAVVKIKDSLFLPRESSLEVWLVQGIPKGEKMELIIQKATELGIRGIIPLKAQRCVVKLEGKKEAERRKRWQKVALEAVKQCRRTLIPTVMSACTIQEFIQGLPQRRHLFIPWEEGGLPFKVALKKAFAEETLAEQIDLDIATPKDAQASTAIPVYLVIGPEGGFAAEEVQQMQKYGGMPISLGPRILRTETAGLAALSALMFAWGDWG